MAHPLGVEWPSTESEIELTLAQALPKGDRIETVIHMCTEIGFSKFIFFEADRSVVRWDEKKRTEKLRRLNAIAQESAEQSFRVKIPEIAFEADLASILKKWPEAVVLSEVENLDATLGSFETPRVLVVGPEGGWSPRELELIGRRGVTLGPRVLRTDTAGPAASAILLLNGRRKSNTRLRIVVSRLLEILPTIYCR